MMTEERARELAEDAYEDRRDKLGYQEIEHVTAVAEAVPSGDTCRAVAWLHDAVEDGLLSFRQMYEEMSSDQFQALLLVTREPGLGLTYMNYIRTIADAPGLAGEVARVVKIADLEHNMRRPCPPEMEGMRRPGGRYDRAIKIMREAVRRTE